VPPAIETTGLAKTYRGLFRRGGQQALRGVDLTVESGTAFGLIGPNGAGKTTFIKSILGVVRPSGGAVRVLGGDPEDPRVRARIGYLPERLHLPPAWNARQFLRSVGRLKGLFRANPEIERLLGKVGLTADAGRRIGGFSKGMRQRLGLAAALIGKPELLILDEPTDGVDPLGRIEVREILKEELARGATLFVNSHLLAETERVCHRIAILVSGRIAREGRLDALTRPADRWLVRFAAGADAEAVKGSGLLFVAGDTWRFEGADAKALNEALDRARAAGALIVEVSRETQSLEEVLSETVEASA
jgi:ABC-2 type transport system ATP-binding protein